MMLHPVAGRDGFIYQRLNQAPKQGRVLSIDATVRISLLWAAESVSSCGTISCNQSQTGPRVRDATGRDVALMTKCTEFSELSANHRHLSIDSRRSISPISR